MPIYVSIKIKNKKNLGQSTTQTWNMLKFKGCVKKSQKICLKKKNGDTRSCVFKP